MSGWRRKWALEKALKPKLSVGLGKELTLEIQNKLNLSVGWRRKRALEKAFKPKLSVGLGKELTLGKANTLKRRVRQLTITELSWSSSSNGWSI